MCKFGYGIRNMLFVALNLFTCLFACIDVKTFCIYTIILLSCTLTACFALQVPGMMRGCGGRTRANFDAGDDAPKDVV